jgi:sulfide:quinone oxidoreductase
MSKVVVLGAGVSGHTAAAFIKKKIGHKHEVVVVTPNSYYQWVPSNIWVGVGKMTPDQVRFKLQPKYDKWGIVYKQAKAVSIHPQGNDTIKKPFVTIEYTEESKRGQIETVDYDFLVNATGPKLNFQGTEGLGPDGHTLSVCTTDHASHAWIAIQEAFKRMEKGEKIRFLIGVGHPIATCQGAAFEYALNLSFEIRQRGLEDKAEITWITNEYEVGDFGMGGAFIKKGGYITSTKVFAESMLIEYGIKWIKRAGVRKVEKGRVYYENLDGEEHQIDFDYAMLIPQFTGVGLKVYDNKSEDITPEIIAPNGFMKVDADYSGKAYDTWTVEDWPSLYQNQKYDNIFAPGIAFAPPHPISKPMTNKNGLAIFPSPPRTGMPAGVAGKIVALNIADAINKGTTDYKHRASMGKMGAACIISAGYSMTKGLGASMTVYPIVPDWKKYPDYGRDLKFTLGDPGISGHWLKLFLHYMFIHKAKGYPFWWLLPE